jgi:histidine ammonia-lyase
VKQNLPENIVMGTGRIRLEEVVAVAQGKCSLKLSDSKKFVEKIERGARYLDELLEKEGEIYGVTTGYGDSCTVSVPLHLVEELPLHLTRFHGCGLGKNLDEEMALAVVVVRMCSLAQGYSGVSINLLRQLEKLLNHKIIPVIPEEGSVGASGDLTPLSYVAAVLVGERDVFYKGERRATAEVYKELDIKPIRLRPKEGLAVMNGTAVMTAMACFAYSRAEYLSRLCSRLTSMATIALRGDLTHFNEKLFSVKPHPGQIQVAARIRADLNVPVKLVKATRLQERYSIRCAPHIIGVLEDALPWMKSTIENELNSTNDNPVIADEQVLHGGHFYGGHIAFVMDSMKNCVANLADLMDRQMALLVDTRFNNGLPANLSGSAPDRAMINHGFKAVQIGMSAWTAEALKLTMPASVFSRSTECHNQDKVSMGTIAARDCLRILELTEQVAAALLLGVSQALEIRQCQSVIGNEHLSAGVGRLKQEIFEYFRFVDEDRPLEADLRKTADLIRNQAWELYP